MYTDWARGIRNLSDRILAIGWDDTEEYGIPNESDDSFVESSTNDDGHVNHSNEEYDNNGNIREDAVQDGGSEELNGVHHSKEEGCNNQDIHEDAVLDEAKEDSNVPMNDVDDLLYGAI